MKIYTKTGDHGETGLLGGQRVGKENLRVETYGTVDETNAALGLAKATAPSPEITEMITMLQQRLFAVAAELATAGDAPPRITAGDVSGLEALIDRLALPRQGFAIPGDSACGAALDLARTIIRRAERRAVELSRRERVGQELLAYLNRLSDFLFVLARYADREELVKTITRRVKAALREEDTSEREVTAMLCLDKAKQALAAAEAKAAGIGVPMVIAVVDEGANLVALHRMDGALLGSVAIAQDKAYTAAALRMPTHELANLAQPGQPLYGIGQTSGGRIILFGGGLPLVSGGKVVGGIGASGGSVEQDIMVAQAGLAAYQG